MVVRSGLGLEELRDPLPARSYVGLATLDLWEAACCLQRRLGPLVAVWGWACSCWRLCLVSILRRVSGRFVSSG